MIDELTPRARAILAAVERAAEERRRATGGRIVRLDGALLAALEMSVAGLDREAVAARLHRELGVAEPEALLDAVFGPGTAPRARLRRLSAPPDSPPAPARSRRGSS